jgi:hypothetical protein
MRAAQSSDSSWRAKLVGRTVTREHGGVLCATYGEGSTGMSIGVMRGGAAECGVDSVVVVSMKLGTAETLLLSDLYKLISNICIFEVTARPPP